MIFYVIIGLSDLLHEAFRYQYESAGKERCGGMRTDGRDVEKMVSAKGRSSGRARTDFGTSEMFTFLLN